MKNLLNYKFLLKPHYFFNIVLAVSFFALKEIPYVCEIMFGSCEYEMVRLLYSRLFCESYMDVSQALQFETIFCFRERWS